MKTEVLFSFDAEDYTSQRNADAILALATMLSEEGVTGHFAVVGLLAQQLVSWGRQDVLEALAPHVIGCHSYSHSMHPVMAEMSDVEDYETASRRVAEMEQKGLDILRNVFKGKDILFAVPPGSDTSYTAQYFYAEQGIPFYFDTPVCDKENSLLDYCSLTHVPYAVAVEQIFMGSKKMDVERLLDELSGKRRVILYHHPNMSVKKVFWDKLNYNGHNERAFGDWIDAEDRPLGETIAFWSNYRRLIRRLKADGRFVITDAYALLRERQRHAPPAMTQEAIPPIAAELRKLSAPAPIGSYCVSDLFYAMAEFLKGGTAYVPGLVKGFLSRPEGIQKPVTVSKDDIRQAAAQIKTGAFIPEQIRVGDALLGPADYLFAMAEALCSGAAEVTLQPRPQLVDISGLPRLEALALKGKWLFSPDFQDSYVSERLRLQAWTLRRYGY